MKDFEDTQGLSSEALHHLLADGDARDRVLAIWALALRSAAATTMANQLRGEPDPGVRRALAVVLAGNGEVDLLVALSRHDPSVHVRASATQMVVRFAAAGRVPWSLVVARFADVAEVRAAVASQIDAASPPELHAAVVACLRDDDELVRREAFETCAKLVKTGVVDRELLRETLDRATAGECANLLATWFKLERPDVIATLLAPARRAVREDALRMRPELIWTDLAPLLGDDAELYDRIRHSLRLQLRDAPVGLVLAVAVRTPGRPGVLEEVVARIRVADRLPAEHVARLRQIVVSRVEAEDAGELALCYDDDDDSQDRDDYALVQVALLVTLREHLARLAAAMS